jgi:hypothetical protein
MMVTYGSSWANVFAIKHHEGNIDGIPPSAESTFFQKQRLLGTP